MDRVIKNLRGQMILCKRMSELFSELSQSLKESTSGSGVTSSVQAIESVMLDLSKTTEQLQDFLKSERVETLKEYIDAQPANAKRNVAVSMLKKVGELQIKLRQQLTDVNYLLINSKAFIDFHINVVSHAVASTTYGPSGGEPTSRSGRNIFSANV